MSPETLDVQEVVYRTVTEVAGMPRDQITDQTLVAAKQVGQVLAQAAEKLEISLSSATKVGTQPRPVLELVGILEAIIAQIP